MSPEAIAFDLDGTLVDSAGAIAHALNTALGGLGLPHFDLKQVRAWIGDGPDALIARALASMGCSPESAAARAAPLRQGFDAATMAAPMADSTVFNDIPRVVKVLASRYPVVVITNKPTLLASAVLEKAELLAHFAAVHGADTAPQRKPAPLLIEQAAARLGIPTSRLLMVGDAAPDILAARAAGSAIAWAGWGYGHPPPGNYPLWRLAAPRELLAGLAATTGAHTEHQ